MGRTQHTWGLSRYIGRLNAWLGGLTRHGLEPFVWPAALSWALGSSLASLAPDWANAISVKYGGAVLVALALALYSLLTAAVYVRRRRQDADSSFLQTSSWLGRRACALFAIPWLLALTDNLERRHPFQVVGYSVLVGICVAVSAYQLTSRRVAASESADEASNLSSSTAAPRARARAGAWGAIGLLWLAYTAVFSFLSINNHLSFNTGRADLGFYVSIFRRSSLGDPLGCTLCGGGNHLSGHFDPLLVLLSPVYWIWPTAQMTLVLQSAWLGSSIFPLYLIARRFGLSQLQGVLLGLCFCAYPALHGVNLFDFHSLALLVPIAIWMLWAIEAEKPRAYLGFLLLLLLTREDAALLAVFIGLAVMMSGRRNAPVLGASTMIVGLLYFVFVKTVVMQGGDPLNPHTGKGYAYYYSGLVDKGSGTPGLVATVMSEPRRLFRVVFTEEKILFLLQLFAPVLFLPLLARRTKITLGYGLAFTLLASRQFVPSLHFHYTSVIIPFVFVTTAMGVARLNGATLGPLRGRSLSLAASTGILVCSLLLSWKFGGVVSNKSFRAGFKPLQRTPSAQQLELSRALDDFCRTVGHEQGVVADGKYLPHLARCGSVYAKSKRHNAKYLIWRMGKGKTSRLLRREIKQGYVTEERDLIQDFKVYRLNYP